MKRVCMRIRWARVCLWVSETVYTILVGPLADEQSHRIAQTHIEMGGTGTKIYLETIKCFGTKALNFQASSPSSETENGGGTCGVWFYPLSLPKPRSLVRTPCNIYITCQPHVFCIFKGYICSASWFLQWNGIPGGGSVFSECCLCVAAMQNAEAAITVALSSTNEWEKLKSME